MTSPARGAAWLAPNLPETAAKCRGYNSFMAQACACVFQTGCCPPTAQEDALEFPSNPKLLTPRQTLPRDPSRAMCASSLLFRGHIVLLPIAL